MSKEAVKDFFKQISPNSYYDIAIILPLLMLFLYPSHAAYGVVGFVILCIYGIIKKDLVFHWNINISWVLFFVLYVLFFLKASDTKDGLFELEKKLSFLVFGILFLFKSKKPISLPFWIFSFMLLVIIRSIIGLVESVILYNEIHIMPAFFTSRFSQHIHPSYLSFYIIICLIITFYWEYKKFINFPKWFLILFSVISIVSILLLSSLSANLFLFFSILAIIIYFLYKKLKPFVASTIVILLIVISFGVIKFGHFRAINFSETYNNTVTFLNNPREYINSEKYIKKANEKRLILWTLSWQKIKENPMGYGVGSAGDVYKDVYNQYGLTSLINPLLDSHNQYLRIALEMGVIGIIAYLGIICVYIVKAFKQKKYLLLYVMICFLYFGMWESFLQRQSGVIFFTYMITFLFLYEPSFFKNKIEK
ncbi:MAG TPA: O-antigen ligase family protein [Bacteroidales bacterium]|nr:O-antigen ligase family protein [Bacteroidales bacterium]HNW21290.1 O-antigen ligase family protein [Bacteroidales bacterium]HOH94040.1 O-antigen ligase family protein [Bacteroidales bacterium]